jgi:GMP synthase-like glutamine amidotransferase
VTTAALPALVLEHDQDAPAGLLGAWAAERGVALEVVPAGAPIPDPATRPFLVSLGAEASAYDDTVSWLAAERAALDRAIGRDVPILGICFGGQHLARALGGGVAPAPRAEVGWLGVESLAPDVVPHGPWLQWHRDAFTVPPGAELLARSPVGAQAFRSGRHLGVQFHPEVTPQIMEDWVRVYRHELDAEGVDPDALLEQTKANADANRRTSLRLLDTFLDRVARLGQKV